MIWNPIKYFRLKRDWRLVSTLEATYVWRDKDGDKDTVYYYLKENGLGERKCDHVGTGKISQGGWGEHKCLTHKFYLKVIRPWLAGRYDPDIPSYETIKTKEFKDKLTGRIT